MSLGAQSGLILLLAWVIYLGAGIALMARWKPFRAGVAMAGAASLPLIWQALFTDSDAPGFVFFFAVLSVPAAAAMLLGVAAAVYRRLWSNGQGG